MPSDGQSLLMRSWDAEHGTTGELLDIRVSKDATPRSHCGCG